jgi:hypothetical protein
VAGLAASGGATAAVTSPTAHPAAGRTLIPAAFETEYGENTCYVFGLAARAGHRVRRTENQSFELAITAFTKVFINGHQLLQLQFQIYSVAHL